MVTPDVGFNVAETAVCSIISVVVLWAFHASFVLYICCCHYLYQAQ